MKSVNLINKQYRLLLVHPPCPLGFLNDRFHILLPSHRGIDLAEFCAGGICDHLGEGRLSRSRGTIKNDRG